LVCGGSVVGYTKKLPFGSTQHQPLSCSVGQFLKEQYGVKEDLWQRGGGGEQDEDESKAIVGQLDYQT
jgi:hypothetical protein